MLLILFRKWGNSERANFSLCTLIRLIEPSKYNDVCLCKALVLSTEIFFIDPINPINPIRFLEPKDNCDPTRKELLRLISDFRRQWLHSCRTFSYISPLRNLICFIFCFKFSNNNRRKKKFFNLYIFYLVSRTQCFQSGEASTMELYQLYINEGRVFVVFSWISVSIMLPSMIILIVCRYLINLTWLKLALLIHIFIYQFIPSSILIN